MCKNIFKNLLSLFICALTLVGLGGSTIAAVPILGGVTDRTDYNAPKVINSKDITGFQASFYLIGEWYSGCNRHGQFFTFEVKDEGNGSLMAVAKDFDIKYPADTQLLTALQNIIDDQKLVSDNGLYRVTAGLPPEYQPCNLAVKYASGEKLEFTVNNDPDALWIKKTYLAFAQWFAAKGNPALLPPEVGGPVENLALSLQDNGKITRYGPCYVEADQAIDGEDLLLTKWIYDWETDKNIYQKHVLYPADYAQRVEEILSSHDIRAFNPWSALYGMGRNGGNDRDDKEAVLELVIDYGDNSQVSIKTSDEQDLVLLKPLVEELRAYHETLF